VCVRDNIKVLQQTLDLAQKSYERDKEALDFGGAGKPGYFPIGNSSRSAQDGPVVQVQFAY
jgi:hypothetical protein